MEAIQAEPVPYCPSASQGRLVLTTCMSPHASQLVLEYRGPDGKPDQPWSVRRTVRVGAGLLLLAALIALGITVFMIAVIGQLDLANENDWPALQVFLGKLADRIWQGAAEAPWYRWIEPIGWALALPAVLTLYRSMAQRRLYLCDDGLRIASGLPAWLDVGAWGSWALPYKDIASIDLVNYRAGRNYGPRPLQRATLQFNNRDGKAIRRLAVMPWHRPGDGVRPKVESSATWLGVQLGSWKSEEDQQTLRRAYDALPLIVGLRQRGVAVPALAKGIGAGGDDLFENPRMKALILTALALAPAYFAGALLLREYWVVTPPIGCWAALGLFAAIAGAIWMRGAAPAPPAVSAARPLHSPSPWANPLIVSMLFGLSAASAAFAAVPLVSQWLFAAEDAVFVLRPGAVLEPVASAGGLPSFRPAQSIDFWISRKPGSQYTLQMRRLPWGYWQYGVDAFRPEIEAFEYPPTK